MFHGLKAVVSFIRHHVILINPTTMKKLVMTLEVELLVMLVSVPSLPDIRNGLGK